MNVLLGESTLREKARLAGPFADVFRQPAAEALLPRGECLLAPAFPIGIDELPREPVPDAPLPQRMTDFDWTLASRHPLDNEIFCEPLVGEKILGLERVQRLADQPLGKTPRGELAAELGARVLAAGQ